jgi:hypothetical protein
MSVFAIAAFADDRNRQVMRLCYLLVPHWAAYAPSRRRAVIAVALFYGEEP